MKVAVISANLGDFDGLQVHAPQSIPCDYYLFSDENFPPRTYSMSPRLQAKIPKCFGWQMAPGYDYYMWIDGGMRLKHPDSLKYFMDSCVDYDFVVLRHPKRPNIRQETRYIRKGVRQSPYIRQRYAGELLAELYSLIGNDKDYLDDTLLAGGIFLYRNTSDVQAALKEWWHYQTRYHLNDQLSLAYVLKKSGLKVNIRPDSYGEPWFMGGISHNRRS
jgi:hypothetical protein